MMIWHEHVFLITGSFVWNPRIVFDQWYEALVFWLVLAHTSCWTSSRHNDDVIKWKHFPRYWPYVRGFHRPPVNSPQKGQWHGALMFSLICAWINGWVNNGEDGDLKRHRAHYEVSVMIEVICDSSEVTMCNVHPRCRNISLQICKHIPAMIQHGSSIQTLVVCVVNRPAFVGQNLVHWTASRSSDPFSKKLNSLEGLLLRIWLDFNGHGHRNVITAWLKCGMKLLIHFQTSTAQPLKFGQG